MRYLYQKSRKATYILFVFFMVAIMHVLHGQEYHFINLAEGLKTRAVGTMITDRQGNVWIAGYDGIHKHEGNRIYHFSSSGPKPYRISGSELHALHESRDGYIWAGSMRGVDRIDPITHQVLHYPLPTHLGIPSFGYLYSIFQDDTDTLWVSTDEALLKLNPQTAQFIRVPKGKGAFETPSPSLSYISGMKTTEGIWMHSGAGIMFFNFANRQLEHAFHNPRKKNVFTLKDSINFGNPAMAIADSNQHIWWVHKNKTLIRYHWPTDRIDSFPLPKHPQSWPCCESIAIDPKGKAWVGFRHGGVLIVDPETGKVDSIRYRGVNSPIPSNYVHGIICHPSGQMWVSTDNGLAIIDYYALGKSKSIISQDINFQNLKYSGGTISSFRNQELYLPFSNYGYFSLNLRTGDMKPHPNPAGKERGSFYVVSDEQGKILLGTDKILLPEQQGATLLPYGHQIDVINTLLSSIPGEIIWCWFANRDKAFFKKASNKLVVYNKGKEPEILPCAGFKKNVSPSFDSQGVWYLSPDFYLIKYHLETQKKDSIDLPAKLERLSCGFSNPRDITDDGISLWITSQNGLLRYYYKKDSIICYNESDGLAHGFTFSLARDKQNRIWVLSLSGIDYFNTATNRFENIMQWPLESYMDAFGSSFIIPSGELFFTAGNKLFRIDPEKIFKQSLYQPPLKINQVLVNGEAVDWRKGLHVKHDENKIQVRYGLMDFTNRYRAQYSYRFEGDKDWSIDDLKGDLQFAELSPGTYKLILRATNSAGKEIGETLSFSFTVAPPWYKTWWFRSLLSAALIGLAWWIVKQRIKAIRTKAAIKQELTELESKALRAQMNPHFIFNSLNAIQELVITNQVDSAYTYLSHFSRLLRLVLNHSEKELIPLEDELQVIRLYVQLESLRFKNSFQYHITISDHIDTEESKIPPMLLQPFIENAIWHGLMNKKGEKWLHIQLTESEGNLVCTINDNGIGREASAKIKMEKLGAQRFESKGTLLSLQRVAVLNRQFENKLAISIEDIMDDKGNPNGTKVILIIPQNNESSNGNET